MDSPKIETNELRSPSNGCCSAEKIINNLQCQRKLAQGCSLGKMHDVANVKKTVKRWFAKNIGNNASKKLNRRIGDDQQVNIGDNLIGQFEMMMLVIPNKYKSKLGHIQTLINQQTDRIIISNGVSVLLPKGRTTQEINQFSIGLQDKDQMLKEKQIKQIKCFDKVKNRAMNSLQGKVEDQKQKKQQREDQNQNFVTPKRGSQYNDISNESSVVDEPIQTQSKQLFHNNTFEGQQGSHNKKKQVIDNKIEGQNKQSHINERKQKKETKDELLNKNKMQASHQQPEESQKKQQPKSNPKDMVIEQPATIKKETKIQEKVDIKLKIQQTQNIRNKDWFKQLQKLSVAQTQLTYMAQHFQWLLKFYQNNAHSSFGLDMFQCKAQVKIFKNNAFLNFSGFCPASKSKKDSRHQSSIKCLASLYLCVEGLWDTYSQIKKDTPSLCQQHKSDNNEILEDWLLEVEGLQKKTMKLEDEQKSSYSMDAHTYVQSLTNCKKELYYMIAQNNKIFMNPKWKLSNENMHGWWFSQCVVRYEVSEKVFEYRIKCKGQNRRDSQQAVSKGLLKKIYTDFPTLFKKFKKIKHERGLI